MLFSPPPFPEASIAGRSRALTLRDLLRTEIPLSLRIDRVEHCCESNLQPARHTQARHFNALPADRLGPAAFSNGPGPRPVHSHYWKSWFAASAAAAA
ncbi:Hypothetical protein NTJ_02812 [Nesidiocoris tenuis]|uniref:Uncharacterized protein n=1 Tax=Nesidiocoris tenuis TaxID=355587 RepID=A0ABN7AF50_9HEMI|nr:Hypothetical protein NTJ_02812 [Nesidiocoris tenuis]